MNAGVVKCILRKKLGVLKSLQFLFSDNKYFAILSGQRFSSSISPIQEMQSPNHQRCSFACLEHFQCISAEYQRASKKCRLFRETPTPTTTEADVGYIIYK